MLSATDPEAIVKHLARRSGAAGVAARKAMLGFVRKSGAPAIATLAKQKAPRLFGDLKGSVLDYDTPQGARITFGGLAAAYAPAVHEDESIPHSGERSGRWVYRGTMAAHEGAPNPPRGSGLTHAFFRTKKGGRRTGWSTRAGAPARRAGKWWRRKAVTYAKRYPAIRYPKTGQAHFLHGSSDSAYAEKRPWMIRRMAEVGVRAAGEAARKGVA